VRGDAGLAELEQLLNLLLGATALWSERRAFDESVVGEIRRRAILASHTRYAESIPAYRQLAGDRGLLEVDEVDVVASELMVTTQLFKSYDPRWLDVGDYRELTDWVGTIFVRTPRPALDGVRDITDWRDALRRDGVYVTSSSGTSGRPSFVPRDRFTWDALRRNGRFYAAATRSMSAAGDGDFDCLVLGARGNAIGIQAAARGLTRSARRSHYLFDVELGLDVLTDALAAQRFAEAAAADEERAYSRAFDFLAASVADGRRVLVFGTPFQVSVACTRALDDCRTLRLVPGSAVLTGGGWKHAERERIPREKLLDHIERAFGIPGGHVVDAYSTAECNCVFSSCAHGRYHIPPLVEPVVLDDLLVRIDGDDVHGAFGFLDPFAASYPGFVITGDEARLVRGQCACGLTGWAIVGEIERSLSAEPKGCAGVLASVSA
jgi:Acyl-protein synthetase, LuxE